MIYHVRIKTHLDNFRRKNGSLTNEWDFLSEGGRCTIDGREDCKHARAHAGRKVMDEVFGGRSIAEAYVRSYEIWPATKLRRSQMETPKFYRGGN